MLDALRPSKEERRQAIELYLITRQPTDIKLASAVAAARRNTARAIGVDAFSMGKFTPKRAEIHTAVGPRQAGANFRAARSALEPTPYVHRDHDQLLNELIEMAAANTLKGIILLEGKSSTGKTRSLFEAIHHRLGLSWTVYIPADARAVRALAQHKDLLDQPTVLWLNELQRFLAPGRTGLNIRVMQDLYDAAAAPLVVVATIWEEKRPTPGDDLQTESLKLLDPEQDWTYRIKVRAAFSDAERNRARQLADYDLRLARALQDPDRVGVTQTLAGAGELVEHYRTAGP